MIEMSRSTLLNCALRDDEACTGSVQDSNGWCLVKTDKGAEGPEEDGGDEGVEEAEGADRTDVTAIYIF